MKHVKDADSNCVGTKFFVAKPTACHASLPFLNAYLPLRDSLECYFGFHDNETNIFKYLFSPLSGNASRCSPLYHFTLSNTRLFY